MTLGLDTEVSLPLFAKMIALYLGLPSTLTASMFDASLLPMNKLRPSQSNAIVYGAPTKPVTLDRNSVLFPPW